MIYHKPSNQRWQEEHLSLIDQDEAVFDASCNIAGDDIVAQVSEEQQPQGEDLHRNPRGSTQQSH